MPCRCTLTRFQGGGQARAMYGTRCLGMLKTNQSKSVRSRPVAPSHLDKPVVPAGHEGFPRGLDVERVHLLVASLDHADCRAVIGVPIRDLGFVTK